MYICFTDKMNAILAVSSDQLFMRKMFAYVEDGKFFYKDFLAVNFHAYKNWIDERMNSPEFFNIWKNMCKFRIYCTWYIYAYTIYV